jgi:ceramide synthetase
MFYSAMKLRSAPHKKAPQNDVLEEVFSERKNLSDTQIKEKALELSMTERQVERWLRQRKLQDRPTTLEKFSETG